MRQADEAQWYTTQSEGKHRLAVAVASKLSCTPKDTGLATATTASASITDTESRQDANNGRRAEMEYGI